MFGREQETEKGCDLESKRGRRFRRRSNLGLIVASASPSRYSQAKPSVEALPKASEGRKPQKLLELLSYRRLGTVKFFLGFLQLIGQGALEVAKRGQLSEKF